MKINRISSKLIKPHTPTPPNLRNYKISFLDKTQIPVKFAVVLFYESKSEKTRQLEESLAKILVQFYPLAGRYTKNDPFVDCSDEGAEFVEAEAVDVELTTKLVVKNTKSTHQLADLLPDQYFRGDAPNPLLSIQLTHFPSGGAAIAIAVSHLVLDGPSLGTFVAAWSSATKPGGEIDFTPSFDLPSLLPCKDHDLGFSADHDQPSTQNQEIVVKRVLFDKVALTSLRSKLSPNRDGKTISRVLVVSALIAKVLIGVERTKHGKSGDFVISQAIDMRERTSTPVPKHACGNLIILSLTPRVAASEGKEIGMEELVDLMGDSVRKSIADCAEILSPNGDGHDIIIKFFENYMKEICNPETNAVFFSDWSKFGLYKADFGWGKPLWASIGPGQPPFSFVGLMSNREGDGIEAWVHLKQGDMRYFEQDEEIKSYIL